MDIDQRIPDLSDKELETLHANAVRLAGSGTQKQRQQAEELLPLLSAALEDRRRLRDEAQKSRRKTGAKAKAAAAAASDMPKDHVD